MTTDAAESGTSPRRTLVAGERRLESLALVVAVGSFILSALAAVAAFRFEAAPISGPNSIGQYAAVASAIVALVAFIAGRRLVRPQQDPLRPLDVLDLVALGFAHAVIALLSWTLLSVVLEQAFIDAQVFAFPVILLGGAAAAVTAYLAFYSATHMDLTLLAVVLAVFLVEGILASMLTASDPHWWQEHLSALGMTDDLSALAFNLTLIVAGIIVTTLARSATAQVPTTHPRGITSVRTCLIVVGVFLGLVGVFEVDDFFWIHTAVASGMAIAFIVLVVRLKTWIPGTPRPFLLLGWLFVGVILWLVVLYATGYYTLTAVELVAGILVFTWIILFIRNAAALEQDAEPAADAKGAG